MKMQLGKRDRIETKNYIREHSKSNKSAFLLLRNEERSQKTDPIQLNTNPKMEQMFEESQRSKSKGDDI